MLQAHGYSSLGGSSSGQPQQMQAPQEPNPQASAFQQANGHLHAHHTNTELGSGFSSGHSSGDLAQIPSPPPSQVTCTVYSCAVSSTAFCLPLQLNCQTPSTLQCWHEWCAIPTLPQGNVNSQICKHHHLSLVRVIMAYFILLSVLIICTVTVAAGPPTPTT